MVGGGGTSVDKLGAPNGIDDPVKVSSIDTDALFFFLLWLPHHFLFFLAIDGEYESMDADSEASVMSSHVDNKYNKSEAPPTCSSLKKIWGTVNWFDKDSMSFLLSLYGKQYAN